MGMAGRGVCVGGAALAPRPDENPSARRDAAAGGPEVSRAGARHVGERNQGEKVFSASSALHALSETEPSLNLAAHSVKLSKTDMHHAS